jgi:hypothetical protein
LKNLNCKKTLLGLLRCGAAAAEAPTRPLRPALRYFHVILLQNSPLPARTQDGTEENGKEDWKQDGREQGGALRGTQAKHILSCICVGRDCAGRKGNSFLRSVLGANAIDAHQYVAIERYLEATKPICSSHISSKVGTDPALGIEPDIAQWCAPCRGLRALLRAHLPTQRNRYLDSHKETQDAAKSSGQAVAMESGGNGWVYTDADVLGMVAPLKFAADDRFAACARGAARAAADARAA